MLERTCKHEKHIPNGVRGESVVCKGSVLNVSLRSKTENYAILGKTLQIDNLVNQNIVVTRGKEINRDS